MEVTNILQTRAYKLNDEEEVPTIKHWLGRERLQFQETFTDSKKRHAKWQKDCLKCSVKNSSHNIMKHDHHYDTAN